MNNVTFAELLFYCGLSQTGASRLLDVRYDTVKSWYYGRAKVPEGVMDDMRAYAKACEKIFNPPNRKGMMMSEIEQTLQERCDRCGKFTDHAKITQDLKKAMRNSRNWHELSDDKKEALEMEQQNDR